MYRAEHSGTRRPKNEYQEQARARWGHGRGRCCDRRGHAGPAATAAPAAINGPVHGCVFQTVNGHYLTAVGGGGRTTDTIHSDATQVGSWEKFTVTIGPESENTCRPRRLAIEVAIGLGPAPQGK